MLISVTFKRVVSLPGDDAPLFANPLQNVNWWCPEFFQPSQFTTF
jgi:hypothetical protein